MVFYPIFGKLLILCAKNRGFSFKPLQVGRRIKGTRFSWKRETVKKLGTFSVT